MKGNICLFCLLFILSIMIHTVVVGSVIVPHANRIIDIPTVDLQQRPVYKKHKPKPKVKTVSENVQAVTLSDNKARTTSENSISDNSISDNSVSDNEIYKDLKLGKIPEDIILDPEKVAPETAIISSVAKGSYKPGDYWFVCSPGRKGNIVIYTNNMLFKLNIDGVRNFTDTSVHLDENSFFYTDKDFKVKTVTSLSESSKSPNLVNY